MTPRLDYILEGVLLAAGEPLSIERLESVFDENERPGRKALRDALERLEARLNESALMLDETASGFRLRVRDTLSPWVSRLWDERPQRYSRALLETLALIAYRQPVTRADIEEVRGVSVSASIMRTLLERGWVRVIGHRDVPGRPAVYATTRSFLDDFGLRTLDALPPISAVKEGETIDWLQQLTPSSDHEAQPSTVSVAEDSFGERAPTEAVVSTSNDTISREPAEANMVTGSPEDDQPASEQDADRADMTSSIETPTSPRQSPSLDEIGERLAERLRNDAQRTVSEDKPDERSTPSSDQRD